MKDLATNTRDKPSQIFAQVVSQCDDNVQALLPREENTKRTMKNVWALANLSKLSGE
jgi:hypothetical protein